MDFLISKIKWAFPDSIYYGPITGVDNLPNEELDEERVLYGALRGKSWSEIPLSIIEGLPDGFVLLTDDAFLAFLPAWLTCALTDMKVRELMVYSFSPKAHNSTEGLDHRLACLTSSQKEALHAFLIYCFESESSKFIKDHAQDGAAYVARPASQ